MVVTGTRAEYGLLLPVLRAMAADERLLPCLIVTGMHLLRRFGQTVRQIEADGWEVSARVRMQRGTDDPADQAEGLARGVGGIARHLLEAKADLVLVLGDRIEALAGGLAGVTTGTPVAHIHGGDVAPGDLDDTLRHALSKLAHVHLAATPAAGRRLRRLGEPADRIHVVGAPGLDDLYAKLATVAARRGRSGRALVVQHPCGRPEAVERQVMSRILRVVAEAGLKATVIYPNSDRGHGGIIAAIERQRQGARRGGRAVATSENLTVHRSLPRDEFLDLLVEADVLIGNSSAGILEAPIAGTPAVDVGDRQMGREPAGPGVVSAGESRAALQTALQDALARRPRRCPRTPYGDGHAGPRIAEILATVPLGPQLTRKKTDFSDRGPRR